MFYEVDALLSVDENGIVMAKGQKDVWMARLHEWLRTPSGSVYGLPHWGNPMEEFMVRKMNHRFENFLTMNSSVNNAVMMRHRERYSHKMLLLTCF